MSSVSTMIRNDPIHQARQAMQQRLYRYNRTRTILGRLPPEVFQKIFEHLLWSEYEVETAFGAFVRPRPHSAPLSVYSTSRDWNGYAAEQTELWTAVSGTQHEQCTPHPELVKLWLGRAGSHRVLRLHMSPPLYEACGHEDVDQFSEKILKTFLGEIRRWGGIAFELDEVLGEVYVKDVMGYERPEQLENLELTATACSQELAARIFWSIGARCSGVRRLYWKGPKGFSGGGKRVRVPRVVELHVAGTGIEDVCGCLDMIDGRAVEEVWIGLQGTWNRGVRWERDAERLKRTLKKMARMPSSLVIEDDGIGSVQMAGPILDAVSGLGIVRLEIVTSGLEGESGEQELRGQRVSVDGGRMVAEFGRSLFAFLWRA